MRPEKTISMGAKFSGTVIRGKQLGNKLGFPTANLSLKSDTTIEEGVYAAIATVDGKQYNSMANVGRKPSLFSGTGDVSRTKDNGTRSETENISNEFILEVNLFGFCGNLYGRMLEVELIQRIRGEEKFASATELREAVEKDRLRIEEYFKTYR